MEGLGEPAGLVRLSHRLLLRTQASRTQGFAIQAQTPSNGPRRSDLRARAGPPTGILPRSRGRQCAWGPRGQCTQDIRTRSHSGGGSRDPPAPLSEVELPANL